jgi:hypothetical protein
MSIDRFGDASEAHRRAVAERMAEVVVDVRGDAFELEKTSTDDNQKAATNVLVEWERLDLVRAEGDGESARKELIAWVQALNTMHEILEEQYARMVEQGKDEVFQRIAETVELWDAEQVLRPDDRMRKFTRSSLPFALVHNAEIAKLQLLAPDDTEEEEVDEGGDIGDSDEDEESGSEGDDDDIRSESEEHDDPSEDEDEPAKKQKREA